MLATSIHRCGHIVGAHDPRAAAAPRSPPAPRCRPGARSAHGRSAPPTSDLRDRPTAQRQPEALELRQAPQQLADCAPVVLPKPNPGIDAQTARAPMPAALQAARARPESPAPRRPHRRTGDRCCMVAGSPCMCIRHTPSRSPPAPRARPGARSARTSLIRCGAGGGGRGA